MNATRAEVAPALAVCLQLDAFDEFVCSYSQCKNIHFFQVDLLSVYLLNEKFLRQIPCISFGNFRSTRLDPCHAQITELKIPINSLQNILWLQIQMHHVLIMQSLKPQTCMSQCPFNIYFLQPSQTLGLLFMHKVTQTLPAQLHTNAELIFVLPTREISHSVFQEHRI